jgi:hypothetical protein
MVHVVEDEDEDATEVVRAIVRASRSISNTSEIRPCEGSSG